MFGLFEDRPHRFQSHIKAFTGEAIGVAASLMGHPRLLVHDEPIDGLDADGMRIMRETLVRINREEDVTILILRKRDLA